MTNLVPMMEAISAYEDCMKEHEKEVRRIKIRIQEIETEIEEELKREAGK